MNETVTRGISGSVYVALLVFCTLFSPITFHLLFAFFMAVSIYEFGKLSGFNYSFTLIALGIIISTALYYGRDVILPQVFIYPAIGCSLFNLILLYEVFKDKRLLRQPAINHLFLYLTIPFLLLQTLPSFIKTDNKYQLVVCIFILVWCNDTFAYLVGKKIGKTKLLERVSPKKTMEGFVGGMIFSIIASVIISQFFNFFNVTLWIGTAIFISIFGTLGDLVESKFKREANIKDSGNIMPGHGGILDRLDSVIFLTPFLYFLYLIYFTYVS
jgi:phosphatidate cytidylyltransferase